MFPIRSPTLEDMNHNKINKIRIHLDQPLAVLVQGKRRGGAGTETEGGPHQIRRGPGRTSPGDEKGGRAKIHPGKPVRSRLGKCHQIPINSDLQGKSSKKVEGFLIPCLVTEGYIPARFCRRSTISSSTKLLMRMSLDIYWDWDQQG